MRKFRHLKMLLVLFCVVLGVHAKSSAEKPVQNVYCGDVTDPIALKITGADSERISIGDRIHAQWNLNLCSPLNADKDLGLVIFAMPNSVRLSGAGFIVIPPQVQLPFGFDWEPDKLRIVFPLYLLRDKSKGTFNFRVLTGSEFSLKGTFVRVGSDTFNVHSKVSATTVRSYPLTERHPSLVIQDKANVQGPDEIIESPDGQYEVHRFPGRIQLFFRPSGLLIFDEFGYEPRFSPGSRFLSFYTFLDGEDNNFRVVDLLDLNTIVDEISVTGVIWGLGDSLLIVGKKANDGGVVYFPYLDQVHSLHLGGPLSWAFSFWDTGVLVDVENGLIAGNTDTGHLEFFDLVPGRVSEHLNKIEEIETKFYLSDYTDTPEPWSREYSYVVGKLGLPKLRHPARRWEVIDRGKFRTTRLTSFVENDTDTSEEWENSSFGAWMRSSFWRANFENSDPIVRRHVPRASNKLVSLQQESDHVRGSTVRFRGQALSMDPTEVLTQQGDSRILDYLEARGAKFRPNQAPSNANAWGDNTPSKILSELSAPQGAKGNLPQAMLGLTDLFNEECDEYYLDVASSTRTITWEQSSGRLSVIQTTCHAGGNSKAAIGDLKIFSATPNGSRLISFKTDADLIAEKSRELLAARNCALVFSLLEKMSDETAEDSGYRGKGPSTTPTNCGLFAPDYYNVGGNDVDTSYFLSDSGKLLIATAPISNSILIYNPTSASLETFVTDVPEAADVLNLYLSRDDRHLLQINETGKFYVYDLATGKRILNGLYIDDEVVLYREDGIYDGTPEGAQFISWYFGGLREHFDFNQFESRLKKPELIGKILNGETVKQTRLDLVPPPVVDITVERNPDDDHSLTLALDVSSALPLASVRIFEDGVPIKEISAAGISLSIDTSLPTKRGQHWLSAVAYNIDGFASTPKAVLINLPNATATSGSVFALGIGINRFPKMIGKDLKYATRDAIAFVETVRSNPTKHYDQVSARVLIDEEATANNIIRTLQELSHKATKDDTLMLYFATHGSRGANGKFYLMTSQSTFGDISGTGLAWDRVAQVLSRIQGKVVVFLDACHSGSAAAETFVPNDAYVAELMKSGKAGMVVIAAAKGRQYSFEEGELNGGHGVFNHMISQALVGQRKAADENENGIIEISELYRYVKAQTFHYTKGRQTPWISRNEMIGEVPLL